MNFKETLERIESSKTFSKFKEQYPYLEPDASPSGERSFMKANVKTLDFSHGMKVSNFQK